MRNNNSNKAKSFLMRMPFLYLLFRELYYFWLNIKGNTVGDYLTSRLKKLDARWGIKNFAKTRLEDTLFCPLLVRVEGIQRTLRRIRHIPEDVGIYHCCFNILVAKKILHFSDIYAGLK